MRTDPSRQDVCLDCGADIFLITVTPFTGKWVAVPLRVETWHCGSDPDHPVKAHRPRGNMLVKETRSNS